MFLFCYFSISVTFHLLDIDILRSDARDYWLDSLSLKMPFHPFHVPGYPVVIAFFRFITQNYFAPSFYLQLISFIAFSVALYLLGKINKLASVSNHISFYAVSLFILWPFVGIVYVVYPSADSLAIVAYLLGLFLLQKEKTYMGSFIWAGALFVHKAMWLFIGISWLFWAYKSFQKEKKQTIISGAIIFLPLVLFTVIGSFTHGSLTWIISNNLSVEISSKSNLPILDGLLGTLQKGGGQALAKGGVLLFQFFLTIFLAIYAYKKQYHGWEFGFAISLTVFILMAILNQYEIWASLRFGRLLVLPLAKTFDIAFSSKTLQNNRTVLVLMVIIGLLLYISQHFYAWYLTVYF